MNSLRSVHLESDSRSNAAAAVSFSLRRRKAAGRSRRVGAPIAFAVAATRAAAPAATAADGDATSSFRQSRLGFVRLERVSLVLVSAEWPVPCVPSAASSRRTSRAQRSSSRESPIRVRLEINEPAPTSFDRSAPPFRSEFRLRTAFPCVSACRPSSPSLLVRHSPGSGVVARTATGRRRPLDVRPSPSSVPSRAPRPQSALGPLSTFDRPRSSRVRISVSQPCGWSTNLQPQRASRGRLLRFRTVANDESCP